MKAGIYLGDCMEVMRQMSDNSIDSIVTDPPYGLSFMGKKWDYDVPNVEIWKEAFRVLKPGGHLLSFAGTRTQHRMAVNIEDAGFEIRDMIAWVYGSGFPKSLNIGKAVDKTRGNEREVVGKNPNYRPVSGKEGYLGESNFRQTDGMSISTKGNSPYEGWGTALKPALEPITVARKPLSEKTVAANVLKWGTGGINIDGCRIETDEKIMNQGRSAKSAISKGKYGDSKAQKTHQTEGQKLGRFPANFIHDGSQMILDLFPETGKSTGGKLGTSSMKNKGYGFKQMETEGANAGGLGDSGSAARYFYCAKASKADRNEGLDGLEEKRSAASEFRPNHLEKSLKGEDGNPYGRWKPTKNNHPTVKPTKLMQYLVRLVTPPNGTVLDPFMGSGSTGKACKLEGFEFIGIELDAEYFEIAVKRINLEKTKLQLFA